jgi:hypothetical protein
MDLGWPVVCTNRHFAETRRYEVRANAMLSKVTTYTILHIDPVIYRPSNSPSLLSIKTERATCAKCESKYAIRHSLHLHFDFHCPIPTSLCSFLMYLLSSCSPPSGHDTFVISQAKVIRVLQVLVFCEWKSEYLWQVFSLLLVSKIDRSMRL